MLRKLNFTERARIARGAMRFTLRRGDDGVLVFDATVDLAGIAAPKDARIYVEALYRTSYQRFDCGSVAAPQFPSGTRLDEIDSERVVRFRVKIVDNVRIVAASNDVTVACEGSGPSSRLSLLPVNFRDLGDIIWRVHFEGEQPVLELNNRVEGIESLARNDPRFFALVYPAALRDVLTEMDPTEEESPAEHWLRWARELTGEPMPSDRDDRALWIDDVVAAFCGQHRVVEKMNSARQEIE